jgi:hypothetical protein
LGDIEKKEIIEKKTIRKHLERKRKEMDKIDEEKKRKKCLYFLKRSVGIPCDLAKLVPFFVLFFMRTATRGWCCRCIQGPQEGILDSLVDTLQGNSLKVPCPQCSFGTEWSP